MAETDLTEITLRDSQRTFDLGTNLVHRFVLQRLQGRFLEVEDVHFHFDSAVMMPDFDLVDSADTNRVTGLAILRAAYVHAQNTEDELLLAGHTDRSGPEDYNLELSRVRAQNVHHLLLGNRTGWVKSSAARHQTEDIQQILAWVDRTFGWGCDPGPIDNRMGPQTRAAIRAFQIRYNVDFDPNVVVTEVVDPPTWGAFFDVYMRGLEGLLETNDDGLKKLRSTIRFLPGAPPTVGCGESHPVSENTRENTRSRIDRRVELLFFEPDKRPRLDCHPGIACDSGRCEIYGPNRIFTIRPIPAQAATILVVHLQLQWLDPTGAPRPFPEGMPVTVVLAGNDADTLETRVGPNGRTRFPVDRSKGSFTLRFSSDNARSISSHRAGADGPLEEQLAFEPELAGHMDQRRQVFLLPRLWSLRTSDWTRDGVPLPPNGSFSGLEDTAVTVGSPAQPAVLTLDPHWQFVRLVYFDRVLRAKRSLTPCVLEGFRIGTQLDAQPDRPADTRSNWTTGTADEARQCVPWIMQRNLAGVPVPKPDAQVVLRYRSAPGTFIESKSTRQLVSLVSANPGGTAALRVNDPGINAGLAMDVNLAIPSPGRMRFYDVPQLWKSKGYFARRSATDNVPTASDGVFESLAAQATSDAQPLIFSLDDMVLTDEQQTPLSWNPSKPEDRAAVFSHSFSRTGPDGVSDDAALSEIGLYRADPNEPYFSQQPARLADGVNQIVDYPDWTRLVVARGDLYEVFDERIRKDGPLVGARAAMRREESMKVRAGQVFVPQPPPPPPPALPPPPVLAPGGRPIPGLMLFPRPEPVHAPFFSIQAFYEQRQPSAATHPPGQHSQLKVPPAPEFLTQGFGRFDLALLRCTDLVGDAEKAVCLSYLRFDINFDPKFDPGGGPGDGFPANAFQPKFEEGSATSWRRDFIGALTKRWNGPDTAPTGFVFNPGPPQLLPTDAATQLRVDVRMFAQHVPNPLAHIEAGVFRKTAPSTIPPPGIEPVVRAFMDSNTGRGTFDASQRSAGPAGDVVAAHEAAHAFSLSDEYVEGASATCFAYGMPGIFSYTPGAPHASSGSSLMHGGLAVRARHYWHLAEWARSITGVDFKLRHGTREFAIRHHPLAAKRSFVSWAITDSIDASKPPRGRFDAFFYPLGEDEYPELSLPGFPRPRGLVVVLVKLRIKTHTTVRTQIEQLLATVRTIFDIGVRLPFGASGVRANGTVAGQDVSPTLLQISSRFLVETLTTDAAYQAEVGATTQSAYLAKVDSLEAAHRVHFHVEIRATGASAWQPPGPPGAPARLILSEQDTGTWLNFFGEMVGIAPAVGTTGGVFDKQNYRPHFEAVMKNVTLI